MKHQFEWHITESSREVESRRGRSCGHMFSRHSRQPETNPLLGFSIFKEFSPEGNTGSFLFHRLPLLSIGHLTKQNWPCDRNTDRHLGSGDLAPSSGRQMSHFTCCNFAAGRVKWRHTRPSCWLPYLDTMTHSAVNYWLFTSNKCPPSCECVI